MKQFTLALFLCLAWSPTFAQQARFGVIIGANVGEPGEELLRYAERDASRFADVLSRFAAVPEENLLLLRGRSTERVESVLPLKSVGHWLDWRKIATEPVQK